MKVLVLLSLVAGAFAFLDCPANQHYDSCGTACPLTCENYKNPPKVCVLMCVPGCHCDAGYVKAEDGSCVMPENCPSRSQDACGENERYNGCGTACPLTCDNYDNPPKICNLMCKIGCECVEGYVRNANGKCVRPVECPRNSEEKNCHEEPETGMCRGYFPMWHFDEASSSCKKFIYGGCGGNGNRYASKEECLRSCAAVWDSTSDVCDLPAETGLCRGYFPRYYFNKATGQCEKFVYGGCGGNENNFRSVDECQNACGSRASANCPANSQYKSCGTACPLTCDNYRNPPKACVLMCNPGCHCDKGYVKTKDGSCVQPENCPSQPQAALDRPDCDKAPETGVCRAYMPRYYYDQLAGMCKTFIYGGCGGNRNNFESEDECYNKCGALAANLQRTCDQPKVVGPCRAAYRRFYFNKESGQCEQFTYGGCQGNDNNFNSQEDCEDVCAH